MAAALGAAGRRAPRRRRRGRPRRPDDHRRPGRGRRGGRRRPRTAAAARGGRARRRRARASPAPSATSRSRPARWTLAGQLPARRARRPAHRARLGQRGAHAVPADRRARAARAARRRRRRPARHARRRDAADRHADRRRALPRQRPRRRTRRGRSEPGRRVLPPAVAGGAVRRPGPGRRRRRDRRARARPPPRCATALQARAGRGIEVLDRRHAADADAGDPTAADRAGLIAIFGALGGIAGAVALFVVAGTFALADRAAPAGDRGAARARRHPAPGAPADRRRGAARVAARRALGLVAGRPLAERSSSTSSPTAARSVRRSRRRDSCIPLAAALGMGVVIAQLAVCRRGAPRRAHPAGRGAARGRDRASAARSGTRRSSGVALPARRRRDVGCCSRGYWAMAFAVLGGILLAMGTGLLGRWLLGIPAARARRAAAPARRRGHARRHRARGEPLAHRGARGADHARRDARRHRRASSSRATNATRRT